MKFGEHMTMERPSIPEQKPKFQDFEISWRGAIESPTSEAARMELERFLRQACKDLQIEGDEWVIQVK